MLDLRKIVPAAFADSPASHVSNNYKFIPTYKVLEELEKNDWIPIFGKQQKTKKSKNLESTKHTIMLRNRLVAESNPILGKLLPTIRLTNSHNWQSTFMMEYLMLRIACANGLSFVGAQFESFELRHDKLMEDLEKVLGSFESQVKVMEETSKRWFEIPLDVEQSRSLTYQVAQARFQGEITEDHIGALSVIRRPEDVEPNLWNIYNRTQENAMKGGNKVKNRSVRAINHIGREQQLNRRIFEIASSFDPSMSS